MSTVFRTVEKQLKDYKGYEIWKHTDYDWNDKKLETSYMVTDGEDAIDFFGSLAEAKKYISTVLA